MSRMNTDRCPSCGGLSHQAQCPECGYPPPRVKESTKPTTETIDKLFLELSQFTTATTAREAELQRLNLEARRELADALEIIGDIEQIRSSEGNSLVILCDDPEAETAEHTCALEACCDFTDWKVIRRYGKTWTEVLHDLAELSRQHNFLDRL